MKPYSLWISSADFCERCALQYLQQWCKVSTYRDKRRAMVTLIFFGDQAISCFLIDLRPNPFSKSSVWLHLVNSKRTVSSLVGYPQVQERSHRIQSTRNWNLGSKISLRLACNHTCPILVLVFRKVCLLVYCDDSRVEGSVDRWPFNRTVVTFEMQEIAHLKAESVDEAEKKAALAKAVVI